MLRLIVDRILFSLATLLFVGLVLFVLTRQVPGSPAIAALGAEATEAQLADFNAEHGLDQPVLVQYGNWLVSVAQGNFGRSFVTGRDMNELLASTLPITLELVLVAFVFAVVVAIPLGVISALAEGKLADHLARIISVIGVSVPGFWLGLLLIRYPAVEWGWFPPGGYVPMSDGIGAHFNSIALPAFALGIYYVAILSRMTRSGMIEVLSSDYIRTGRALGIGRVRLLWYALKNALVPVVSVGAMSFGYMFGWALIIEYLFYIPGMSSALLTAVGQRDYLTMQAIVYVFTIIFIISNAGADILNRALNPKLASL
ncbi:ABC transporter permease [Acuticoccus sediminis]|uniref:ABC transporter permease n=1 Tax=Acuticoccus sediminis TaxID=2184697 RepID=A0A8B2NNW8_9HYPH|nr:ABC transporter permease [Acuticoccus sediminis]RAH97372.1 ABC transporter permease [Acuticoccus sediminis]